MHLYRGIVCSYRRSDGISKRPETKTPSLANLLIWTTPTGTPFIAPLQRIQIWKFPLYSLFTSIVSFIFWNATAPKVFITQWPTQWLSCRPSFTHKLFEDIQNWFSFSRVFFSLHLTNFPVNLNFPIFPIVKRYH